MKFKYQSTQRNGPQSSTSTPPIEINEILVQIFSHLSQTKLQLVAARVSRRWYLVATGLLQYSVCVKRGGPRSWEGVDKKVAKADCLTIGNTELPAPRHNVFGSDTSWSEQQWKSMTALLRRASLRVAEKDGRTLLRVKVLTLNIDGRWMYRYHFRTFFDTSQLTSLTLAMPSYESGSSHIEWVLGECPNLSSLSLALNLQSLGKYTPAKRIKNDGSKEWPLQSLSIVDLPSTPQELAEIFPRMGKLTSFTLVRSDTFGSSFKNPRTREAFWHSLAKSCLQLKSISFALRYSKSCLIPVTLFPFVEHFGIDARLIHRISPIWKELVDVHQVENRLTSLEIFGMDEDKYFQERSRVLHRFLCSSPLLLHFKAEDTVLSLDIFFGATNNSGGSWWSPPKSPSRRHLWACKGLKTLSLDFLGRRSSFSLSQILFYFGYLGRVCPHIQTLSIVIHAWTRELSLGLSLLTRLQDLRRLEFRLRHNMFNVPGTQNYSRPPTDIGDKVIHRSDFVWIQRSSPAVIPLAMPELKTTLDQKSKNDDRVLSLSKTLAKLSQWTGLDRVDADMDYRDCLAMARRNSLHLLDDGQPVDNLHMGEEYNRSLQTERYQLVVRTLQQQKENDYQTEYDRDIPLVDGLKGFQICGGYLDVDACLQARVWRTQQNHQRENATRPWPNLDQMIFTISFSNTNENESRKIERRSLQACGFLRGMRPDVEFLCQYRCLYSIGKL